MSFLSIKNLHYKIGDFSLNNINLKIEKGEFVSIIGKSGSGKTLLLESIAGLRDIEGEIWLDNKNITKIKPQYRNIGIVYQDYMLFPNMNVKQNILYPSLFKKDKSTKQMFNELVDFFGIEPILNRDIKNLSGGEKQKAALARALLGFPKLLLLDEPLNALDFTFKMDFMGFLEELHKRYNLTILYVTHNFKEALCLSSKSAVILDGAIHQFEETKRIFKNPKNRLVAEFLGFKNILPTNIIDIKSHNFFSIAPENLIISRNRPNTDIALKVKVIEIKSFGNSNYMKLSINNSTVAVYAKDKPINKEIDIHLGFNKKDISLFN